jgi:adenine-specific DNA-methyltransferase
MPNDKSIEAFRHEEAKRLNIPTAELEGAMAPEDKAPRPVTLDRAARSRNPYLIWNGKLDEDDRAFTVPAPPLFIQEKVKPEGLINDLIRETRERRAETPPTQHDWFHDFNGLPDAEAVTEFYQHPANWQNRMICGDSLQVMASLGDREGLRGQVQCIFLDPPYGIKFNSNFQWSTTSRDVKDGDKSHISREPEQVRAFRDTWRDGIHSYLSYLRDRLIAAKDLLADSGSIFVQIGDENVHRVRTVMDEVFGDDNFVAQIVFRTTTGKASAALDSTRDYVLWFSKNKENFKFRPLWFARDVEADSNFRFDFTEAGDFMPAGLAPFRISRMNPITSQSSSATTLFEYALEGKTFTPGKGGWKTNHLGMTRLHKAQRLTYSGKTLGFVRAFKDFGYQTYADIWDDTRQSGFGDAKVYVVQTAVKVIERCVLLTTDPGDIVLDPTCGSGTTAYVAEQWGRRWITIDTSRVAIALARSRLMGARYPYYLLADSPEGQRKEGELTRTSPRDAPTGRDLRQGFVYERVPHITLKSIANNAEIDVIWDKWQGVLQPLRAALNGALNTDWQEWQIPREAQSDWVPQVTADHKKWWDARIARQREIDAAIAARAESEYLFDKPYNDPSRIRVAGPFTVESLSPHRTLAVDWDDELIDVLEASEGKRKSAARGNFAEMVMENLRLAGVQQAHKEDRINFTSLTAWPGDNIAAEGLFLEGEVRRRAAIFIGPEYGTVLRADLVAAAKEAAEAGFDILVSCAFSYDAHSAEFAKLGRVPVLKARMNPDLHMADALKATANGNLFVIFGEPDIDIIPDGADQIRVKVSGVDVFKPQTGEVISEGTDGIALWMIDTDYNEESFFVRHAYFLGANDPYKALRTTLKAEIDEAAWESLHSDTSRPFAKPTSGRIAVKVINHLGDEVMKVFRV